jgi:hypothetical protein
MATFTFTESHTLTVNDGTNTWTNTQSNIQTTVTPTTSQVMAQRDFIVTGGTAQALNMGSVGTPTVTYPVALQVTNLDATNNLYLGTASGGSFAASRFDVILPGQSHRINLVGTLYIQSSLTGHPYSYVVSQFN